MAALAIPELRDEGFWRKRRSLPYAEPVIGWIRSSHTQVPLDWKGAHHRK
jgi:hypothetical protein